MASPKNKLERLVTFFAQEMLRLSDEDVLSEFGEDAEGVAQVLDAAAVKQAKRASSRKTKLSTRKARVKRQPSSTVGWKAQQDTAAELEISASFSYDAEEEVSSAAIPSIRNKPDSGSKDS